MQRNAVAEILALGGSVQYDFEFDFTQKFFLWPGTRVTNPRPSGPPWLRELLGPEYFDEVVLVGLGSKCKDEDLRLLRDLPQLRALHLSGTSITDAGLVHTAHLTRLQVLTVDNTNITAAGLKCLVRLSELEVLSVDGAALTDEGVASLRELPNLRLISIPRPNFRHHWTDIERVQRELPRAHTEF
jgi:hypothetical protein